MPSRLSGADKATYDSIFRHPVAHNVEWRSLIAVFNHIGEIEEESNGKLKFTRNGQTLTVHPEGKNVGVEELIHIRHFLDRTHVAVEANPSGQKDVLVVLDHSGARIFTANAAETKPEVVLPIDPSGHDKHVHNPLGDSGGKQGPLRNLFYEALVKQLEGADRIHLVGDGQGASSEVEHFIAELQQHHHQSTADRIVGTEVADISHMTDGDFAAKARTLAAKISATP